MSHNILNSNLEKYFSKNTTFTLNPTHKETLNLSNRTKLCTFLAALVQIPAGVDPNQKQNQQLSK